MPYVWTDPEVALEHSGVTVWHIYKDDDFESGRREYLFGLVPYASETGFAEAEPFDVRNLSTWSSEPDDDLTTSWRKRLAVREEHVLSVLRAAIDKGELVNPEEN